MIHFQCQIFKNQCTVPQVGILPFKEIFKVQIHRWNCNLGLQEHRSIFHYLEPRYKIPLSSVLFPIIRLPEWCLRHFLQSCLAGWHPSCHRLIAFHLKPIWNDLHALYHGLQATMSQLSLSGHTQQSGQRSLNGLLNFFCFTVSPCWTGRWFVVLQVFDSHFACI